MLAQLQNALTSLAAILTILQAQAAELQIGQVKPEVGLFPNSELKYAVKRDFAQIGAIQLEVRDYIILKSKEYGVDELLALDLAWAESNFYPDAKNPKSSAKGVYQWLDSSWACEGNVLNYKDNVDCALQTIGKDKFGIRHWTADLNTRKKISEYVVCGEGNNNCELKVDN